jgi:hypothetical protein
MGFVTLRRHPQKGGMIPLPGRKTLDLGLKFDGGIRKMIKKGPVEKEEKHRPRELGMSAGPRMLRPIPSDLNFQ